MPAPGLRSRLIALAAAYALALQGFLAALAPVPASSTGAGASVFAVCSGAAARPDAVPPVYPSQPSNVCDACVMAGCGGGAPTLAGAVAFVVGLQAFRSTPATAGTPRAVTASLRQPQIPRAPPVL